MSASASQSKSSTETNSAQLSTQGASGDKSPTLTAGGSITYNDGQEVSLAALQAMGDVIKGALSQSTTIGQNSLNLLGEWSTKQIESSAAATDSNSALLSTVLAQNSSLASHVQTNGSDMWANITKYVLFGLFGLGGLITVLLLVRRK
jgi:hypothetical protein